jgi:hypothetical protein
VREFGQERVAGDQGREEREEAGDPGVYYGFDARRRRRGKCVRMRRKRGMGSG